ncbi:ribosome-binding factor A [Gemmatimonadota bacterium]|nr:ribosome-binding factor A [Gemmatimonadota bacterium]
MPPRDTRRPDRVAAAVREEIAMILAEGVRDARVTGFVTVTGVEMSRDLVEANVFVSIFADEPEKSATFDGLQAIAPTFRSRIGRALRLRLAPRLNFRLDESVARAARIETLLATIKSVQPAVDATDATAAGGPGNTSDDATGG